MLKVKNLTKKYGKNLSVDSLSFSVGKGETVGLLGPNGAGKSTTMRMITGYVAPSSGSVRVMGEDMAETPLAARKHIGYLPETPPLYPDMTVAEHLGFVCDLRGVGKKDAGAEIARVCGDLHIADVAHRPIRNLSKGYRQRVGFAGALIGKPKLLVLDEPTVGLDPRQIIEIRGLIQRLSGSMSIILSSHILSEVASVCSRIIIMHGGRILADGKPGEIEKKHAGAPMAEAVVRGDGAKALAVLRECAGNGGNIRREDRGGGRTRFLIPSEDAEALCERIFHALAARESELSLIALRPLHKTLEQIYIDITKGPPETGGNGGEPI